MNPCRTCIKQYPLSPCTNLGHCPYEDTNENPINQLNVYDNRSNQENISTITKTL
jgi:hypothetical protein